MLTPSKKPDYEAGGCPLRGGQVRGFSPPVEKGKSASAVVVQMVRGAHYVDQMVWISPKKSLSMRLGVGTKAGREFGTKGEEKDSRPAASLIRQLLLYLC